MFFLSIPSRHNGMMKHTPSAAAGTAAFTISVMGIELPWVLDEPFPKPMKSR